jgi:gluconokinase
MQLIFKDTCTSQISNIILQGHQKTERRHIWLIIGPTGCGKSTIGDYAAKILNLPFIKGDNVSYQNCIPADFYYIPCYNNKSQSFTLLPTSKRCLEALGLARLPPLRCQFYTLFPIPSGWCRPHLLCPEEVLPRYNSYCTEHLPNLSVHSVYLRASEELLSQRVSAWKGNYIGAGMVRSQLASLEEPTQEETDVISIDASRTKTEVVAETLRRKRYYENLRICTKLVGEQGKGNAEGE